MVKKVLLSFRAVQHGYEGEGIDLKDFSWKLHLGERVWVQCAHDTQYDVLWRLFQRNLKPNSGRVEDLHQITTSSDQLIASRMDTGQSMLQNLDSRLFDKRVRFEGRPLFLNTLMEHLQIPLSERRKPLVQVKLEIRQRFQLLAMMAARVQLLLFRPSLDELDSIALPIFNTWASDYSGALVMFGETLPPTVNWHTHLTVNADGTVQIAHAE